MKVRVMVTAKARKSPGYVGKSPDDVVAMLYTGAILPVYGDVAQVDGLAWRNVEVSGLSAWMAVESDGEQILMDVTDTEGDFDRSFWFVMRHEGGSQVTDDPNDPGGLTKYGISQRSHPHLDIRNLNLESAKWIYELEYWKGSGADKLPWPLNLTVFDFAVNAGCLKSMMTLTESGGDFTKFQGLRKEYYQSLELFKTYGAGWINRVNDLERYVKDVQVHQQQGQ